ncbi:hypothetical protein [Chondromyces crocatus]|uniref:Uncharacterized protein n=1 Tax=Chondromyces crocatus TaxID=52 RepID=A0A0K1EBM1_CHOCO|nr:hypothetical protein [Chondromyces crocatus]AKT38265.1 uncharacterized protein CMC5_024080 [Chondromyces crocatus]
MDAAPQATSECIICRHKRRDAIEAALSGGVDALAIAQRFSVTKNALRKHAAHWLEEGSRPDPQSSDAGLRGPETKTAVSKTDLKNVANVRARCEALVEKVEVLIQRADTDEEISWRERAALIVAAKQVLELLGRLTGEIGPAAEATIVDSPRWKRIEGAIAGALAAYPEAAAAVAKALAELEAA